MTRVTENSVSGRNVISGAHRFKIFEGPLVEVPKARVERRICTSFLGVQGMLTRKMFESRLSEMPFPGLWGEICRIVMVKKRHCNISDALANVFALQPGPGGPHLAHWGWGPPVSTHSSYATVACDTYLQK